MTELPFGDRTDFENAERGRIDALDPCLVRAADGRAQTGISGGQQALAYLVFAVIGTLGVGIPVVLYFALGDRSGKLLAQLKDWMTQHNAVIMTVLCLIIGVKLIGDAISGLTS